MNDTYWAVALDDLRVAYRARVQEYLSDIEALLDGVRELPCCHSGTPLEAIRSRVHSLNATSAELGMPEVTHAASKVEELCDNLLESDRLDVTDWQNVAVAVDALRQAADAVYQLADAA